MQRSLFGGAIVFSLPERFEDVSEVREIPDNQEAFVDIATDESIIVELVEHDATVSDMACCAHYFDDLAALNAATTAQLVSAAAHPPPPQVTAASSAYVAVGQQTIAKFKESASNAVNVYLAVVRMPTYGTDVLITLNSPVALDPASSSSHSATQPADQAVAREVLLTALHTLSVLDYSLFG
jgi:hypothetical protein